MIPGPVFLALMKAKEKQGRGEPLTEEEQKLLAQYPDPPPILCGCGCGQPLHGSGNDQYMIGGKHVRPDCWYDQMGEELEKYPIMSPRLRMLARRRQPSA